MATTTAYPVSNSGVRVLSRSSWPKRPHPLLRHILSTGIGQDLANHPEAQVNCASPNRRNERLSNERAAALIGWSVQVRLSRDRRPRPVLPRIGPVQWHGTLAPHNPGVATAIHQASANRCRSAGVDQVPIRQPPTDLPVGHFPGRPSALSRPVLGDCARTEHCYSTGAPFFGACDMTHTPTPAAGPRATLS